MKVLLTGGAGYIGSHTAIELLNKNIEIVIVDDFSNSNEKVLDSIRKITDILKLPLLTKQDLFNDNITKKIWI